MKFESFLNESPYSIQLSNCLNSVQKLTNSAAYLCNSNFQCKSKALQPTQSLFLEGEITGSTIPFFIQYHMIQRGGILDFWTIEKEEDAAWLLVSHEALLVGLLIFLCSA